MKRYIKSATGSTFDLINALQNRIDDIEDGVVTSTQVKGSEDDADYRYAIEDTRGLPQAGVDVQKFEEWYELEEYLDENPDVMERIQDGYATIVELD